MKTWPNVKVVVSFITILSFTPLQISANNFYTKSELIKSVKDNTAEYNSGLYKFVTGFIFSNAAFALDRPPASNLRPTNPGQNPDVIKNIGTALDDEVDTQLQKYIADDRVVELVKEGDKYVAYRVKKVKNYADIPYEKRKAGPVKKLGVFNQERGKKLYEITDQAIVQRLDKIGRRIAYVEGVDRILEGKKSLVHTGTRDWYGEYLLTNLLLSPNTDLLERIAKHEQKHEIPGYRHEDDPEYLQLLDEVELFAAGTNHLKQQRMQYTGNKIQAETERDAILNRIRYFRERVVSTEPISQEAIDADSQELVELLKYPDKDLESPAFWAAHALDGLFQSPRQINQEIIDKRSQELVELLKHDSYGNRAALALGYLFRSPRQINQEIIDKRSQELVGLLKHPNSNVIWWTTHALRDLFQRPRQKIPQEIINAYAKELVELLKKYGGNSGAMDCLKELFLSDKEVPQEIIDDASKELIGLLKVGYSDTPYPGQVIEDAAKTLNALFKSPREISQETIDNGSQELVELLAYGGDSAGRPVQHSAQYCLLALFQSQREMPPAVIDACSKRLIWLRSYASFDDNTVTHSSARMLLGALEERQRRIAPTSASEHPTTAASHVVSATPPVTPAAAIASTPPVPVVDVRTEVSPAVQAAARFLSAVSNWLGEPAQVKTDVTYVVNMPEDYSEKEALLTGLRQKLGKNASIEVLIRTDDSEIVSSYQKVSDILGLNLTVTGIGAVNEGALSAVVTQIRPGERERYLFIAEQDDPKTDEAILSDPSTQPLDPNLTVALVEKLKEGQVEPTDASAQIIKEYLESKKRVIAIEPKPLSEEIGQQLRQELKDALTALRKV